MTRFTPHYRTAVLAEYRVGNARFLAETSTRPGFHVATYVGAFVDPRSIRTYATAAAAIDEAARRAAVALRDASTRDAR